MVDMSRNAHLSEDQEHELVKSIRKTFGVSNRHIVSEALSNNIDSRNSDIIMSVNADGNPTISNDVADALDKDDEITL